MTDTDAPVFVWDVMRGTVLMNVYEQSVMHTLSTLFTVTTTCGLLAAVNISYSLMGLKNMLELYFLVS